MKTKIIQRQVGTVINRLMLIAGLSMGLAGVAQASLIDNTINVWYVWPSAGNFYLDIGTITATSAPQTVTLQPYFNVTISDTQVVVDGSNFPDVAYSGSFNGQALIDESVTTFPDYTVDPSSRLPGGTPNIAIIGNTLEIDFHGLTFNPGDQLVLDFGASVPEPATFGLLGLSLPALALLRRRRTT